MFRRLVLVAGLVVAAVLAVAGCSDSHTGTTQGPVVDPGGGDAVGLPSIPDLPDAEGGIADASFDGCRTELGTRTVDGTVTNSTEETVGYVVVVSWVDGDSQVLARGVTEVDHVAPGDAASIELTAEVPEGAVTCTYYVLRAPTD